MSIVDDSPGLIFRRFLVWIQRLHRDNAKKLFIYSGVGIIVLSLLAALADYLLPFGMGWNFIRTAIMLPLALCMFVFAYGLSLVQAFKKIANSDDNKPWVPLRRRWSPAWRRRIAAITIALCAVFLFAATNGPAFTFLSALFGAYLIAMFAFMRLTQEEKERDALGVPDARDIAFQQSLDNAQRKRELKAASRKEEKDAKKNESLNPFKLNKKD